MYKSLFIITGLLSIFAQEKALASDDHGRFIYINGQRSPDLTNLTVEEKGSGRPRWYVEYVIDWKYLDGVYTGPVSNGGREGCGIIESSLKGCDFVYAGDWKNDKKSGKGASMRSIENTCNAIDVYKGDWKDDQREGHGKYVFYGKDGKAVYTYVGDWKNDKKEGTGTATWNEGDRAYVGKWKASCMVNGTMTFIDPKFGICIYRGDFGRADNIIESMQGIGMMQYENGDIYNGEWDKGKKKGYGIMAYENGTVYTGFWNNDKREGPGELKISYGKPSSGGSWFEVYCRAVYEGEWENDVLKNVVPKTESWKFKSQSIWELI